MTVNIPVSGNKTYAILAAAVAVQIIRAAFFDLELDDAFNAVSLGAVIAALRSGMKKLEDPGTVNQLVLGLLTKIRSKGSEGLNLSMEPESIELTSDRHEAILRARADASLSPPEPKEGGPSGVGSDPYPSAAVLEAPPAPPEVGVTVDGVKEVLMSEGFLDSLADALERRKEKSAGQSGQT